MNNQFPSSRALRTPGCFVQYSIEYLWSSISRTSIYVYDVEEALNKHSEATSVYLDKSFYEIKRARFKGWVEPFMEARRSFLENVQEKRL